MVGIIVGIVGGTVGLIVVGILLYVFVFSKAKIKKQIKEIERKFSYLDALLIGQDSQYIHRLEIISRTNLLYVDKHSTFTRRFREIYETDDKFVESLIRQLNSLVANKQYKNIKNTLMEARKALEIFEDKTNQLDKDLYELIKLEEDSRQTVYRLKEQYRVVKQSYYAKANELELASSSFNRAFDKLDAQFVQIDEHIESAEYDETAEIIPEVINVINALGKIIDVLPNLCSLVQQVIPEKIEDINAVYRHITSLEIPVYHLNVKENIKRWQKELDNVKQKLKNLSIGGCQHECDRIIKEIEDLSTQLLKEESDKTSFETEKDNLYQEVKVLDDEFIKICSILPRVHEYYVVDALQNQKFDILNRNIDRLWSTKRSLDGFIHSETKQPYSVLQSKLDDLRADYNICFTGLKEFKTYLDSLKTTSEEAYSLVSIYFYRAKQIENTLRLLRVPEVEQLYAYQLENVFKNLNEINLLLQEKPIDVKNINDRIEDLKRSANDFFEQVENKFRDSQLAESAVVYANRDRNHQTDVHQQLSVLENDFFKGEFANVYKSANSIYNRSHVEDKGNV